VATLIACSDEHKKNPAIDYTGFKEQHLTLLSLHDPATNPDTMGWITLQLPARLDTFYSWQHYSDCENCGQMKYRFADNHYDQYAESGLFWTVFPDSVYQFNTWHKPYSEIPDSLTYPSLKPGDSSIYFNRLPELVTDLADADFQQRSVEEINGRLFFITVFTTARGYLTQRPSSYLVAMTRLQNRSIHFIAECGARDCRDFSNLMYKAIRSIQIIEK
jgi:hypothetical protein